MQARARSLEQLPIMVPFSGITTVSGPSPVCTPRCPYAVFAPRILVDAVMCVHLRDSMTTRFSEREAAQRTSRAEDLYAAGFAQRMQQVCLEGYGHGSR
jgi:hypothetical protein